MIKILYIILIILLVIIIFFYIYLLYKVSHRSKDYYNTLRFRYYTLQDFTDMTHNIFDIPKKYIYHYDKNSNDIYEKDLNKTMIKTNPIEKPVALLKGDIRHCFSFPILQKTRHSMDLLPKDCKSIIIKLSTDRHFGSLKIIPISLEIFLKKKSILLWRGATTGPGFDTMEPPVGTRAYMIKNYFNKYPFLDIGIQGICSKSVLDFYKTRSKPHISKEEHMNYRYIISIQGHDVASNLKWLMGSSSLVFMCKPTVISWFMEDRLIPFYHYVELKEDFSDLEEKFNWAENNPEKCVRIIQNAQKYTSVFLDEKNEELLMKSIIQWYKDNIKYKIF